MIMKKSQESTPTTTVNRDDYKKIAAYANEQQSRVPPTIFTRENVNPDNLNEDFKRCYTFDALEPDEEKKYSDDSRTVTCLTSFIECFNEFNFPEDLVPHARRVRANTMAKTKFLPDSSFVDMKFTNADNTTQMYQFNVPCGWTPNDNTTGTFFTRNNMNYILYVYFISDDQNKVVNHRYALYDVTQERFITLWEYIINYINVDTNNKNTSNDSNDSNNGREANRNKTGEIIRHNNAHSKHNTGTPNPNALKKQPKKTNSANNSPKSRN
jgi:hypothetical protein